MAGTLVFDLDGTLVDSVPDLTTALNLVLAQDGLAPLAAAEVARMVGDGAQVLLERGYRARSLVPDVGAMPRFLAAYEAHVADGTRPYPGVCVTLDSLAQTGWRLAVCTNKPVALARQVLAALGLADRFAAICGGDSFSVRKPDPGHLIATLNQAGQEAGVAAAGAVMVGDHANDVAAARGAGIPCIFAAWGYGSPEMAGGAAAVAERFEQVADLAARIATAGYCVGAGGGATRNTSASPK